MSNRRLAIFAALATAFSGAGGQDLAQLEARVDSLRRLSDDAGAALMRYDQQARTTRMHLDTVIVGPLHLLADPGIADLARAAARIAADTLAGYGEAVGTVVARHWVVVKRAPVGLMNVPDDTAIVAARIDESGRERHELWATAPTPDVIAAWLLTHTNAMLTDALDFQMDDWLTGAPRFDTVSAYSWGQLRLAMVSSRMKILRDCYGGSMAACRKALGIDPTTDPIMEWYDARGRRNELQSREAAIRRLDFAGASRCLAGQDTACVALMQKTQLSMSPFASQRVSLMQLALQQGGPHSLTRLLSSTGSIDDRLASASGMPTDRLLQLWHERLRSVRPPSDDLTAGMAAASLAWILILGGLGLRSSRWR